MPVDDGATTPAGNVQLRVSTDLAAADPAYLTVPPEGLGNPPQSVEDTTYPRMDGTVHYADWWEPRIVTWPEAVAHADDCPDDVAAKVAYDRVEAVKYAWRRRQDDVEAWITVNGQGPFAIVGRPRVATVDWLTGYHNAAAILLRFDCADHRLFVLDVDDDGNVIGDGWRTVTVPLSTLSEGRTYDRVYGVVRDHPPVEELTYGSTGDVFVDAVNAGSLPAPVQITFVGVLADPALEDVTTGAEVELVRDVDAGASNRVEVDTGTGRVTVGGAARFGWVRDDPREFVLPPGTNTLRLRDDDPGSSDGYAIVRWRAATL